MVPLNLWDILSRVGALQCYLIIALFKSQGSRQGQMVSSDFPAYVSEETHSVGSVTGVIIPWSIMF